MEMTMYDDTFRFGSNDFKATKRPVTLDLDSPGLTTKKQRLATVLTSPDLNMLKLSSPELEKFIIAQNGAITTTPTPTQFLFPKIVTEEQEKYAKGFVDVLAKLHQNGDSNSSNNNFTYFEITDAPATSSVSATSHSTINSKVYAGLLPTSLHTAGVSTSVNPSVTNPAVSTSVISVVRPPSVESSSSNSFQGRQTPLPFCVSSSYSVKEELQTVPSVSSSITPPVSPINLEDQERIKLERKRYRNRIAATKCRRRKLERIAKLEEKVKELKNENTELGAMATKLREQVCSLKQEVLNHVKSGCQIMLTQAF